MSKNIIFSMNNPLTYSPTNWENDVTPLNEDNMNNIEDGIVQLTRAVNKLRDDNYLLNDSSSVINEKVKSVTNLANYLNSQINGAGNIQANSVVRQISGILHYMSEMLYQIYGIEWKIVAKFNDKGAPIGVESKFKYPGSNEYTQLAELISELNMNPTTEDDTICLGETSFLRSEGSHTKESLLGKLSSTILKLNSLFEGESSEWLDEDDNPKPINVIFDTLLSRYLTKEDIEGTIDTLGELVQWAALHENSLIDLISNTNANTLSIVQLKTDFKVIKTYYDEIMELKDSLSALTSIDKSWSVASEVEPGVSLRFKQLSDSTGEVSIRVNNFIPSPPPADDFVDQDYETPFNETLLGKTPAKEFCVTEGNHTFPVKMTMAYMGRDINNVGYINISPSSDISGSISSGKPIINPAPIAQLNASKNSNNAWMSFGYMELGEFINGPQFIEALGGEGSIVSLEYYDKDVADYTHIANAKVGTIIPQDGSALYYIGKVCYKGEIYDSIDYSSVDENNELLVKGAIGLMFSSNRFAEDYYINDVAKYCNYDVVSGSGQYYIGPDKLGDGTLIRLDSSTKYGANLTDCIEDVYVGNRIPENAFAVHNMNSGASADQISVFSSYEKLLNGGPMVNGWGAYYQLRPSSILGSYKIVDKRKDPADFGNFTPEQLNFTDEYGDIYLQIKNATLYSSIYNLNIGQVLSFINLTLISGTATLSNTYVYEDYNVRTIANNRWFGFHRDVAAAGDIVVEQYNADEFTSGDYHYMVGEVIIDLMQPTSISELIVNCLGPNYDWSIGGIGSISVHLSNSKSKESFNTAEPDFYIGGLSIPVNSSEQITVLPTKSDFYEPYRYCMVRIISEPFGNTVVNPTTGSNGLYFNWLMINEIKVICNVNNLPAMVYSVTPDLISDNIMNDTLYLANIFNTEKAGFIPQGVSSLTWLESKYENDTIQVGAIRDINLIGQTPYGCYISISFDDGSTIEGVPDYYIDLNTNTAIAYIGTVRLKKDEPLISTTVNYIDGINGNFARNVSGFMWNVLLNTDGTMLGDLKEYIETSAVNTQNNINVTACLFMALTPITSNYIASIEACYDLTAGNKNSLESVIKTGVNVSKINIGKVSLISNLPLNNTVIKNIDASSVYCIKN